jgi:MFS transporter, ACS family, hexuronate transporter
LRPHTIKIPNLRWLIVAALSLACGLSYFDRQVLSVLAPTITSDLRMDNIAYSWVVFAYVFGYSVMFSVGGWLIDRLGTRRGLALAVGVWSLASLLHAITHNVVQLAAFRLLLGIGEGGCFPGAAKGVMEWFSKKERAIAMGIATSGGSAFGAVIAPPVVVWTAIHAGWRGAFLITGVLGMTWLGFWLLLYSRPENSQLVSEEERRFVIESAASESANPVDAGSKVSWHAFLKVKELRGLVVSRFLFDPVFYFYMFWIPQYLHQERGASLVRIGQLTWIPFLVLGISSILGGWVSDSLVRRGLSLDKVRKGLLLTSALLTPISIFAIFAHDVETAIAMMSVFMFAHGFWITNYMTMIGDLFPRRVATAVGLTGTAGGIGGFLSSLVIGRVVQRMSFTPVFVVAGVIYPICTVILFLAIRKIRPLEPDIY